MYLGLPSPSLLPAPFVHVAEVIERILADQTCLGLVASRLGICRGKYLALLHVVSSFFLLVRSSVPQSHSRSARKYSETQSKVMSCHLLQEMSVYIVYMYFYETKFQIWRTLCIFKHLCIKVVVDFQHMLETALGHII